MGPGMFDDYARMMGIMLAVGCVVSIAIGIGSVYLAHYVASHLFIHWVK